MKQLTIFRILSFILIPIAAIIGLMALIILINGLVNPTFLLVGFILATVVIYTVVSLQFLFKGIDSGRKINPSLRDWIRVNAFVCGFLALLFIMNGLSVFFSSDIALRNYISTFRETQPNLPATMDLNFLLTTMKVMAVVMFVIGLIIVIHIRMNFKLLKTHAHLFDPNETQ